MIIEAAGTRVRCLSVKTQFRAQKPINMAYPTSLSTLGDHLRKVRLDRGLSQPQVAKLLKVTTDSVTGWELNRYEPQARLAKRIIHFLGYFPFNTEDLLIGSKLYYARLISGMTQEQVAKEIGCDESNLRYIELGLRNPGIKTLRKIECFTHTYLKYTKE
jgi:transcriptional regulator with XRE-family HTH domain